MKYLTCVLMIIFIIGSAEVTEAYEKTETYTALRKQALSLTEITLGKKTPTIAVLMETGYPEAVATLVAVADGSASIYFSNGGGIIGAGEYKQVHDSSLRLLSKAALHIKNLALTNHFPLPKNGFTRFYVITPSGIYTDEVLEDDLGNERHALSQLFLQGHELISYIRTAEEHRSSE